MQILCTQTMQYCAGHRSMIKWLRYVYQSQDFQPKDSDDEKHMC